MITYICTGTPSESYRGDIENWLLDDYDPLRSTFARDKATSIGNARAAAITHPHFPVSHDALGEPVQLERMP